MELDIDTFTAPSTASSSGTTGIPSTKRSKHQSASATRRSFGIRPGADRPVDHIFYRYPSGASSSCFLSADSSSPS